MRVKIMEIYPDDPTFNLRNILVGKTGIVIGQFSEFGYEGNIRFDTNFYCSYCRTYHSELLFCGIRILPVE